MKKNSRLLWQAWIVVSLLSWSNPDRSRADSPTEQLMSTVTNVMELLRDAGSQDGAAKRARQEQLRQTIFSRFDFAEMGKRSLGTYWRRYPTRQKEFVSAFSGFAQGFYLGMIERFRDAKVLYTREVVDEGLSQVDTRIVLGKRNEVPIHYRMRLVGDEWKVYDVHVRHGSFVNHSRSQFYRLLFAGSFDDLLRRLAEQRSEGMDLDKFRLNPSIPYLLLSARPRF